MIGPKDSPLLHGGSGLRTDRQSWEGRMQTSLASGRIEAAIDDVS